MYIIPKQVPNSLLPELVDSNSSAQTVKESVAQQMSFGYKESFTELTHPTAIDKMLLPASPQVDPSAVEGNFEKQKQINENLLDSSAVEGNFEKQKQINSEAMEVVINSQKWKNLKV